ncbi:MAG TPA: hypothetical protein VE684_15400 [Crenalkalicoccus sp.]|jgi:hypothetical protein|nr:hypothetical protein [Crenalkalicoccus sp.]
MPMHVIAATHATTDRPVYFLGYGPNLAATEALWTADPWRARWLDGDEAEVETRMLADLCPACTVTSLPLIRIGAAQGR